MRGRSQLLKAILSGVNMESVKFFIECSFSMTQEGKIQTIMMLISYSNIFLKKLKLSLIIRVRSFGILSLENALSLNQ